MFALRRSPLGIVISLVASLALVGFGATRVIHKAADAINQASTGTSDTIAADASNSLVRQANLAGAIAKVRDQGGAEVL